MKAAAPIGSGLQFFADMPLGRMLQSFYYRSEVIEVIVFDVGMNQLLALPIHDADVHLSGVKIYSAIELCGGGVILHTNRSLIGASTPSFMMNGLCGEWKTTLRSVAPDDIKKTTGFRWEYQSAAGNSRPAGQLTVYEN